MDNKDMTLAMELVKILVFMLAAFLSVYIIFKSTGIYKDPDFTNYYLIEKDMEISAREYMSGKSVTEKTIINSDILKNNNLFSSTCNGYVVIDNNFYDAFIKCGDTYTTAGYVAYLAN